MPTLKSERTQENKTPPKSAVKVRRNCSSKLRYA